MITNKLYSTDVATILAVGASITGTAYAVPAFNWMPKMEATICERKPPSAPAAITVTSMP